MPPAARARPPDQPGLVPFAPATLRAAAGCVPIRPAARRRASWPPTVAGLAPLTVSVLPECRRARRDAWSEGPYLQAADLAPTGLHVLRHTAAKLRREAREPVEAVSAFLDHSSLAVTTVYLRRLEGEADRAWVDGAAAIGV